VVCVGLALDDGRDGHDEIFQRFSRDLLKNSSAEVSDDSEGQGQADPDTSGTIITGRGFEVVPDDEPAPVPPSWGRDPSFAQQRAMQEQELALARQ
jgi:hypothetical protein